MYLSGGSRSKGVGIFIARKFQGELSNINFTSYSQRLCTLDYTYGGLTFRACCCYFPTSWDEEDGVDELYDLLNFLMEDCRRQGRKPVFGGDFNASLGKTLAADALDALGTYGDGPRNERGKKLARWVLQHGLQISSRHGNEGDVADSWTCQRYQDGGRVQIDYIIADSSFDVTHS